MNISVKGIHYEISEKTKEYLEKKLGKLSFAEENILDFELSIGQEHNEYLLNLNVHLKWGAKDHFHVRHHHLYDAIDHIIEKAVTKVRRQKEKKIDSHHIS